MKLGSKVLALSGSVAASLVATAAVVAGASLMEAGCYDPRICTSDQVPGYGNKDGEGALISPDIWESSPQRGKWLPFPKGRTWYMVPRGLEGRGYFRINVYVSPDEEPADSQFTTGAGNLAEVRDLGDALTVFNATCENYYVRVVAEAYPRAPDAGPLIPIVEPPISIDGGSDASDASTDAPDGD